MIEQNRLTFNGHDLSEIITVSKFNKGVRLGRSSNYQKRNRRKGVDRLGFTSEVVRFTTDFMFKDIDNKKERLAEILNVTEPKALTNSSEPGIVYYAFPVGDIDSDETSIFGDGTITWEIPDGVSYSVPTYTFTNEDINGIFQNYITVDNPGTEPMELEMEARFTSDNGFLGIESSDGTVRALFGDMTEVDKTAYEKSELLFDDHLYMDRGWSLNNGVVPPVTPNPIQQGTVTYLLEGGDEGYVRPLTYGSAVLDWSGPSLTKTIPEDSEGRYPVNWDSNFRIDFNPDGDANEPSNIGHQSLSFIDQNNKIIISLVFEDNHPSGRKSDFAIYLRDKRVYDTRNTTSYYTTARPSDGNGVRIEKIGSSITVELKTRDSDFKTLKYKFKETGIQLRKITWYAAKYHTYPAMRNNLLRAINTTTHNVTKWNDIPNKFKIGDELVYGKVGRNIQCTLNEFNALRMRDIGSSIITAPPGTSVFYLAYSEFSDTPTVTLTGKARYIV